MPVFEVVRSRLNAVPKRCQVPAGRAGQVTLGLIWVDGTSSLEIEWWDVAGARRSGGEREDDDTASVAVDCVRLPSGVEVRAEDDVTVCYLDDSGKELIGAARVLAMAEDEGVITVRIAWYWLPSEAQKKGKKKNLMETSDGTTALAPLVWDEELYSPKRPHEQWIESASINSKIKVWPSRDTYLQFGNHETDFHHGGSIFFKRPR